MISPSFDQVWREYYNTDHSEDDCPAGSRPKHGCRCNECRAYRRFMSKLRQFDEGLDARRARGEIE